MYLFNTKIINVIYFFLLTENNKYLFIIRKYLLNTFKIYIDLTNFF